MTWINVEDQLPEQCQRVLATNCKDQVEICTFSGSKDYPNWFVGHFYGFPYDGMFGNEPGCCNTKNLLNVLFWQSIPEAPENPNKSTDLNPSITVKNLRKKFTKSLDEVK